MESYEMQCSGFSMLEFFSRVLSLESRVAEPICSPPRATGEPLTAKGGRKTSPPSIVKYIRSGKLVFTRANKGKTEKESFLKQCERSQIGVFDRFGSFLTFCFYREIRVFSFCPSCFDRLAPSQQRPLFNLPNFCFIISLFLILFRIRAIRSCFGPSYTAEMFYPDVGV